MGGAALRRLFRETAGSAEPTTVARPAGSSRHEQRLRWDLAEESHPTITTLPPSLLSCRTRSQKRGKRGWDPGRVPAQRTGSQTRASDLRGTSRAHPTQPKANRAKQGGPQGTAADTPSRFELVEGWFHCQTVLCWCCSCIPTFEAVAPMNSFPISLLFWEGG